ncbi:threonylcarbamoyl-AMP synthase [Candidatus Dojkabacteria bacterium]|nr:threonylcarbamoyl-AMP synthase [Candidatus Dojkabacteria bacterium]
MEILKINKENFNIVIEKAVNILKNGGVVIYPTETCYGIGVDATNQTGVDKILEYKTKRKGKPMSIAVTDKCMAKEYVEVTDMAENIYDNYLPGPITVVSKSLGKVARGVESLEKTLGIRIPDNEVILELVRRVAKPITSTSANVSYKKTPYKFEDILENTTEKQQALIDLIIDAGELPHNPPSTVVDTTRNSYAVLRQGEIKFENEEKQVSESAEMTQQIGQKLMSKYRHYLGYKSIIFAMQGELGTGKTQMTKGIGRALGVKESITSPTFIIESNYDIEKPEGSFIEKKQIELIHIDTWRLQTGDELLEMDFLKQIEEGNVFVIEWADKILPMLDKVKADSILVWVKIIYLEKENQREVTISY